VAEAVVSLGWRRWVLEGRLLIMLCAAAQEMQMVEDRSIQWQGVDGRSSFMTLTFALFGLSCAVPVQSTLRVAFRCTVAGRAFSCPFRDRVLSPSWSPCAERVGAPLRAEKLLTSGGDIC